MGRLGGLAGPSIGPAQRRKRRERSEPAGENGKNNPKPDLNFQMIFYFLDLIQIQNEFEFE
jgi:hypothetical protein